MAAKYFLPVTQSLAKNNPTILLKHQIFLKQIRGILSEVICTSQPQPAGIFGDGGVRGRGCRAATL